MKSFDDTEHVGKCSEAVMSFWNNFEIISGKFALTEIKSFQSDVDEDWNNLKWFYFTCNHGISEVARPWLLKYLFSVQFT